MEYEKWNIVGMQEQHVADAVRIHLQAFPGFFLTYLGPGFLDQFYRAFLRDRDALALVAEDARGNLCGVVVGTAAPKGFFRRLLMKHWWSFATASIAALFRRPAIGKRLVRALWYRGDSPSESRRALLSSLAVDPKQQGCGIGRQLVLCWLGSARKRGCSGCYLITDALDNEGVNSFYQRMGWRLEMTYVTHDRRKMNRYLFDFEPNICL
jgi:ribosomal protein S18 acetylase RimI-like enzyme